MNLKLKIRNGIYFLINTFKEEKLVPIPKPVNTTELLKGKIALITGGNGGIGSAIAEAFVRAGCNVIIAGTDQQKLENVSQHLGGGVRSIILNVLDVKSMPDKILSAASLFPENRIDILVNSAGILAHTDFEKISEEEYDSIMAVNAKGTFFMGQAMGNYMIENHIKGHILNVTSSSALRPAWTPYQMSKWAVRGLTLGMADKLISYGITVNAIAPGPTATAMLGKKKNDSIYLNGNPSGRYAMPSEIAELAVFMVSDLGNLIIGDTFYITGGSGVITLHR